MSRIASADLFYNPLTLSTASRALESSSSLSQVTGSIGGAIYDVFGKNPYDLTVGNFQKIANGEASLSVAKAALVLVGICFSASICGAGIYATGIQAHALGASLKNPLLIALADKVSYLGEKVFLTGSVPLYAVGYEFPKYLIENAPRALTYLANQVEKVANWAFSNIIKPVWDVAYPVLHAVYQKLSWAIDKITTALEEGIIAIAEVAHRIFKEVMTPIFNAIEKNLVWAAEKIEALIKEPIRLIAEAVEHIFKNLIIPAFDATYRAITWVVNQITPVLNTILTAISNVASRVFKEIISPAFNAMCSGLSFLLDKTTLVANWVFQNAISPALDGIYFAGKALIDYVIYPLYEKGAEVTTYALSIIGKALTPAVDFIERSIQQVANHTYRLIEKAQNTLSEIFTLTSFA
jgi:hypothetical protein